MNISDLNSYLLANVETLKKSVAHLEESYKKCKKIGLKNNYTADEAESFEAYTARFARTVDIFTQKTLKSLPLVLREEAVTFIDRINFAEKIGAIDSSDQLKIFRDLRNEIAHDYALSDISEIHRKVMEQTDGLILEINNCIQYVDEHKLTQSG